MIYDTKPAWADCFSAGEGLSLNAVKRLLCALVGAVSTALAQKRGMILKTSNYIHWMMRRRGTWV